MAKVEQPKLFTELITNLGQGSKLWTVAFVSIALTNRPGLEYVAIVVNFIPKF
jgi:hypothetical protein